MTTHVFIVDESTFHFHLEYLFAGTGAGDSVPIFLSKANIFYPPNEEKTLVSMLADCSRVRKNDNVIFYLQSKGENEGRFFGVFKIDSDPFLDLNGSSQFLAAKGLKKDLPFRVKIRPHKIYPEGVTEWTALDDISGLPSPDKMIWSLIYRKLRGNRGNTMITLYEAERLINLIQIENRSIPLAGNSFSFDVNKHKIVASNTIYNYSGNTHPIDILPRLIYQYEYKKAHEAHLQAYITGNLENNASLLTSLGIQKNQIEWIGNEMSCGVGMQKIDVVISTLFDEHERILYVIELKDEYCKDKNFDQIEKYIRWVCQYYCPNTPCIIQPVLISRKPMRKRPNRITTSIANREALFNRNIPKQCKPITMIEYTISGNNIFFI